jgi:lipopolysaccharide export system protein LptC
MADGPGLHTRIVAVLKVGFPILAAGLILSVFVFRPSQDEGGEIVFSEGDVDDLGTGLQITNPTFTGTTREGDSFRFNAELVEPDAAPPTRATISTLRGEIQFAGGQRVNISAEAGALEIPERTLGLEGTVRLRTADGYQLSADQLTIDLDEGVLTGRGDIDGTGPMGRIRSSTLRLAPTQAGASDRRISFGDGVHLIYDPDRDPANPSDETPGSSR